MSQYQELQNLTLVNLKDIARSLGIPVSGSKGELIDRIILARNGNAFSIPIRRRQNPYESIRDLPGIVGQIINGRTSILEPEMNDIVAEELSRWSIQDFKNVYETIGLTRPQPANIPNYTRRLMEYLNSPAVTSLPAASGLSPPISVGNNSAFSSNGSITIRPSSPRNATPSRDAQIKEILRVLQVNPISELVRQAELVLVRNTNNRSIANIATMIHNHEYIRATSPVTFNGETYPQEYILDNADGNGTASAVLAQLGYPDFGGSYDDKLSFLRLVQNYSYRNVLNANQIALVTSMNDDELFSLLGSDYFYPTDRASLLWALIKRREPPFYANDEMVDLPIF